ncbi:MAG: LLM class F420-dependent oxidoreductase [Chloroflexi bacterium]|nr:LLM class F420-dependent oxidoreductase [Chloroflexota bacterium]MDA1219793.1 LLM class F420-dependent oxidoreductase [Chloroflexota bacterium]
MNVGTSVPLPAYTIDPAFMARKAEEVGFESIWYAEHPVLPVHSQSPFPSGGPIPETYAHFADPYIALARASGVTSTIKLATGITLVPERNPLLLAKEIATLDRFSNGRFLFGIGAGWNREETEIFGGDFEHRWTQVRESVAVMKELWTKDEAEYHGRYYDFPLVKCNPKPVQKPHPPIILGGMAKNTLRRVATWGDGWMPNRTTPAELEKGRAMLDTLAAEMGRDPASLTITVYGQAPNREAVQSLLNAGADRVVVRPEHVDTEEEMGQQLERMAEAVLR